MWVLRKSTASKLSLRRRVSLLVIAVILAAFAIVGPLMKRAVAAGDTGTWSGSTLTYNGDKYTSTTAAPKYKDMTTAYQFINTSPNPNIAFVMYFKGDAKDAQTATSAVLLRYVFTSPDKYSDPSPPADVTITPAGQDPSKNTSTAGSAANSSSAQSSCNAQYFGGVGWIVCSVSTWIANGVDGVYQLIKQFLEVDTVTQSDNGVYQIWQMVLAVANICFIIIFLIIVYSQLTSIGISNYSIKDMIPRLIIAAILVNFSFWICQLFVDISNVLGYSIESLFMGIQKSLSIKVSVGWGDLTTVILSGGTIITGGLAFAATAGGSFASLGFILLGALISAGLAVLVAFVILAARQAIIVILVMLSPLAFVAMVLPSTKELFEKWRKAFQTLLLFFPIFAVLFGGSQLAGAAIINSQFHGNINAPALIADATDGKNTSGGQIAVVLIGLAVQVIPLFITPLIIRFSEGFLGRVAGMANDRKRGLVDRAKNWTQSNADDFKMRKLANAAERRGQQRPNETRLARALRQGRPSNLGLALDQSKRTRERRTKRNGEYLENRSLSTEQARINDPSTAAFGTRTFYANQRQRMIDSHGHHELAKLHEGRIEADGERHWAEHVDQTPYLRNIQRQTALTTGVANTITEHNKSQDEVAVGAMIRANSHLQARAIDTGINKKLVADYQGAIDAASEEGHLKIQRANPTYRSIRTETSLTKKRAADIDAGLSAIEQRTYETLVDEAATPQYQQIREIKKQTIVDTEHSQRLADKLKAEGKREYDRAFEEGVVTTFTDANGNTRQIRSRDLQQQNNATEQLKQESASISKRLQEQANAHWSRVGLTDARVQALRVQETEAIDDAKLADGEWNEFHENVRALGAEAPGLLGDAAKRSANSIKSLDESIRATNDAVANAKLEQDTNYLKSLKTDEQLRERAGGIGGKRAQTRIYAKAKDQVVKAALEEIKTNRSLTSELTRKQLHKLMQEAEMPDGTKATVEMQQAAMYTLLQDKGNNEDAQEIRDVIASMGMLVDEDTGQYFEPQRDADGNLIRNEDGFPQIDRSKQITNPDEIERRRDWQQLFLDAKSGSQHSMVTFSGTNQSEAGAGTMVDGTRDGFMRDATGGKWSPKKMLGADLDELKFLLEDLHSPDGQFAKLSDKKKAKARDSIKRSILSLQENENINSNIDDRNRGVMNDILNELDPEEFGYTDIDGRRFYKVDKNNAIVPNSEQAEHKDLSDFEASIDVPGVHKPGKYYKKWDLDRQLSNDDTDSSPHATN